MRGNKFFIDKYKLYAFLVAFFHFVLGVFFIRYAVNGDQIWYDLFYKNSRMFSFSQAYIYYKNILGTSEIGYFFVTYVFSNFFGVEKTAYSLFVNFMLSYFLFLKIFREKTSLFVVFFLCFNFYILVLFFSAERLKLALLFFLMASFCRLHKKYMFLVFSAICHIQVLLLFFSIKCVDVIHVCKRLFFGKLTKEFLFLLILFSFFVLMVFFMREHIFAKFQSYRRDYFDLSVVVKPVIFSVLSMFYAKNKKIEAFFVTLPPVIASIFIGEERVVVFSYFLFMYYGLKHKSGINVGVLSTSGYFFLKGLLFLNYVFFFGDGFYGIALQ